MGVHSRNGRIHGACQRSKRRIENGMIRVRTKSWGRIREGRGGDRDGARPNLYVGVEPRASKALSHALGIAMPLINGEGAGRPSKHSRERKHGVWLLYDDVTPKSRSHRNADFEFCAS